ncbi:hypothetical protein [Mangrovicella endophytica]|uniref:hypothetical protein n=1 Tax=Mangrovicella endophytica TaxID=2066697 RepID=UPI0012FFFF6D|nr:hypothetical protein [Mangrovicella endophytica]
MSDLVIRFSCVVDEDPIFTTQAFRWVRSLIELGRVSPQDIAVHYVLGTDRVRLAEVFEPLCVSLFPVSRMSWRLPHLNKLAQLQSLFLRDADLAVLCDCDTFFLSDPRPYLVKDQLAAAVVDLSNPPLVIWDELLRRAGLTKGRPDVRTGSSDAPTIFENRNGGIYVFPGKRLGEIDEAWRKWVAWLDGQGDILGHFTFHTDQIAFALACLDNDLQPRILPKSLNFPTHLPPEHVGDGAPIVLHYHRHVDKRGALRPLGQPTVDRAIAFANSVLAKPALIQRKQRLVLHVGLPKTGTSALQRWCGDNATELLAHGIRYPEPSSLTAMPKHQFLVDDLKSGRFDRTAKAIAESRAGNGSDCVILSTEGLTNHLYDFRPAALKTLRELLEPFETTIFLVHRDLEDWLRSYHKQCEINPRIPIYSYGLGLDLREFRELPRVKKLMNIQNLVADCAAAYGSAKVVAAEFDTDWTGQFFSLCGYSPVGGSELPRANESVPDWVFQAVLRLNRLGLSDEARSAWMGTLQRFARSRHSGLMAFEAKSSAERLWRQLDPALIGVVSAPDERWTGYGDMVLRLLQEVSEKSV